MMASDYEQLVEAHDQICRLEAELVELRPKAETARLIGVHRMTFEWRPVGLLAIGENSSEYARTMAEAVAQAQRLHPTQPESPDKLKVR